MEVTISAIGKDHRDLVALHRASFVSPKRVADILNGKLDAYKSCLEKALEQVALAKGSVRQAQIVRNGWLFKSVEQCAIDIDRRRTSVKRPISDTSEFYSIESNVGWEVDVDQQQFKTWTKWGKKMHYTMKPIFKERLQDGVPAEYFIAEMLGLGRIDYEFSYRMLKGKKPRERVVEIFVNGVFDFRNERVKIGHLDRYRNQWLQGVGTAQIDHYNSLPISSSPATEKTVNPKILHAVINSLNTARREFLGDTVRRLSSESGRKVLDSLSARRLELNCTLFHCYRSCPTLPLPSGSDQFALYKEAFEFLRDARPRSVDWAFPIVEMEKAQDDGNRFWAIRLARQTIRHYSAYQPELPLPVHEFKSDLSKLKLKLKLNIP